MGEGQLSFAPAAFQGASSRFLRLLVRLARLGRSGATPAGTGRVRSRRGLHLPACPAGRRRAEHAGTQRVIPGGPAGSTFFPSLRRDTARSSRSGWGLVPPAALSDFRAAQ